MDTGAIKLLLLLFISLQSAVANSASHQLPSLCYHTPHPELCMQCFTSRRNSGMDLRRMLVECAMDQAVSAMVQVESFEPKCKNSQSRAAWSDCGKLYQDTVLHINRTAETLATARRVLTNEIDLDVHTWLSAALTNIQTCRLGCAEHNISDIAPSIAADESLSQMIKTILALNAVILNNHNLPQRIETKGNYPSWFRGPKRRILAGRPKADAVVAGDGSGHFRTVQAAIDEAARRGDKSRRYVIHVKRGAYKENILVGRGNDNVMLMGDGMKNTIITSDRSVGGGYTTISSATATIEGTSFIARDITFRNSAGPSKEQAVALLSSSDLSVFYRCAFLGFQDTLYVHSQRQFYRSCYIFGTIDFIFGNAAAVFQKCVILVRRPLPNQSNVVTAQGRIDPSQNTGITFHDCKFLPAKDLKPVIESFKTYLGRPWMPYSRTVVMKSYIGEMVSPLGWMPWIPGSSYGLNTLYYGEYKNYGAGARTNKRVKWKGFHVIKSEHVARKFTVEGLISGDSWLQRTGVPFTAGL